MPAGRLADAWGRKRVFQGGLLLFLAASVACGEAPTVGVLVGARAVQAVDLSLFADPTYRFVNLATLSFGIAFSMMFSRCSFS